MTDEYETLLNTFPPEDLADEDDLGYPEVEADGGCRTCASGQPCRARIAGDIQDILAAADLPDAEPLIILQWLIHEGYSSLTHSIYDMTQQFLTAQHTGDKAQSLAAQNDAFRRQAGLDGPILFANNRIEGMVILTPGIDALSSDTKAEILKLIREFNAFTPDNDPWNEHDFGAITYQGNRVLFKFDYYDKAFEYGSAHPANLGETARVLTVMLAREY